MTQEQQQQMSPAMRTFMSALDGVLADAMGDILGRMRSQHLGWHNGAEPQAGADCHTCVLIGIAVPKQEDADVRAQAPEPVGEGPAGPGPNPR